MNRIFFYAACILCCTVFAAIFVNDSFAEGERRPLLLEGKKSLFQRVVSHPGAVLYNGADGQAQTINNKVKTFTVFYVYGRQGKRIEVGVSDNRADGWLDEVKTTAWKQAITMVFTNRMGRMPVLFFKDRDALLKLCTDEELDKKVKQYADSTASKKTPPDFPVIAAEPSGTAVSEKNFYLLPVLNVDTSFGDSTKLLEVASIDPGIGGSGDSGAALPSLPPSDGQLRTGFVFVIDTTISMKPYIVQTQKFMRAMYDDKLEKNPHRDKIAFAVVAFRSNVKLAPGTQYTSKIICDFKTVNQRAELEQALAQVEESPVPTHAFDEDSFAGVKDAVDNLSWSGYGSRAILLITDAGPLREGDKASGTGMSPEVLADYLKSKNIYLTVMHIKTPAGVKDHASAEKAYRSLSRQADNKASYIALNATTPAKATAEFDLVGGRLATGYNDLITATAEGRMLPPPRELQKKLSPEEEAQRIAEATGYAMQLQFWGTKTGAHAPSVVKAWVADADLEKLARDPQAQPVIAVQPAVLVTKTQLSRLREQLKRVLEQAQQSFLQDASSNFFQSILSAAAQMSRDPNAFANSPGKNLKDAGVMDEFLNDLPYKSRILNLTEDEWYQKTTGEQKSILDHLEARIKRYEEYDRDNANWEGFGDPDRNKWSYRVPLDMLP